MVKGILLRVGIDMGVGGTLAPIFADGSFEFIPFPEEEIEEEDQPTYSKIKGRYGGYLSDYLPAKYKNWIPHNDPEFNTPSYGDPTHKRNSLVKLDKEDLLVFHAGLRAYKNSYYPPRANYLIGYFVVDRVVDFSKIHDQEIFTKEWDSLQNNFHVGYRKEKDCLVVVGQAEKSVLLTKAIPFTEMRPDAKGRPTVAITKKWEEILGIKGFVQRSTPRWLDEEGCKKLLEFLEIIKSKSE